MELVNGYEDKKKMKEEQERKKMEREKREREINLSSERRRKELYAKFLEDGLDSSKAWEEALVLACAETTQTEGRSRRRKTNTATKSN